MTHFRNYLIITIVFLSGLLLSSCASASEATIDSAMDPVDLAAELDKADRLFQQREDIAKLSEAVKILRRARNPNKRNFEVEWKFAQYNYFLGKQLENEKDKLKAFEAGEKAGKLASRIDPKKPDGYFWYAANLGEQAKISPLTVGITKVDDIREALQKVIEIDPGYQSASAYDGLARIELETGMIGGKAEKAAEYAEKGLEIDKDNSNLHLTLAKSYLALDRDRDARKHLLQIKQMKPDKNYELEYQKNLEEAEKLLRKKF